MSTTKKFQAAPTRSGTHKIKGTIVLVAVLGAFSQSALAFTDFGVVTAVNAANGAITSAISASGLTIANLLRGIISSNDASSTKVAEAVNSTGENTVKRNIETQKAMRKADISRSLTLPIDPCANMSMGAADTNMGRVRPGMGGGGMGGGGHGGGGIPARNSGTPNGPPTPSKKLDMAVAIANGDVPAPAPEVQALLAQKGACEAYASGTRAASCIASGLAAPHANGDYANADVDPSSLIDGAQKAADKGKISYTFTQDQVAAARAYMRNLNNPIALRELQKIEASTDAGRAYLGLRDALTARLDLANRPANEWLSNSMPFLDTIPVLKAMIDSKGAAGEYVKKHAKEVAPNWAKEGISNRQLMEFEAERRYKNPEWIKEIATADPATLQREQLMVSAAQLAMSTKEVIETQQARILLGAIYQATANREFMPEVLAAHHKATQSR